MKVGFHQLVTEERQLMAIGALEFWPLYCNFLHIATLTTTSLCIIVVLCVALLLGLVLLFSLCGALYHMLGALVVSSYRWVVALLGALLVLI